MSEDFKVDRLGRQLHKAVCSDCGKPCFVPFKPDPSREVFCQGCYATRRPKQAKKF